MCAQPTDLKKALGSLAEVATQLWPHSKTMLFGSQVRGAAVLARFLSFRRRATAPPFSCAACLAWRRLCPQDGC